MKDGDRYSSNLDGEMIVIDASHNKAVLVKFVMTGNEVLAQKHAILKGCVRDVQYRKEVREAAAKDVLSRRVFQKHVSCLRRFTEDYKKWLGEEKARLKARRRQLYTEKFKRKSKELSKAYQQRKAREHYQKNREYRLEQAKQWQKNNLDKARARNQNRRAKHIGAEGTHTADEINKMLADQDNKCACCKCDLSNRKHLDHIMPLDLGGSNWIENLQWLCVWCNCSKSAKHPDEWAKEVASPSFLDRRFNRSISHA